ncbi:unnamed protein product [Caenorhabditis angaria]|uniref:Uncharacterized protein n=1 Tax=Caenorhabditis angaria TaxID=860376 RepID=A0A9P1MUP0_9PELO|nr:unnamed protein product [Caenorhabditis angaria]
MIDLRLFFILLLFFPNFTNSQYSDNNNEETSNYCSDYVECAAVSLLEERLCLGNSIWRPFWLPQRNDQHKCHDKLKNDYIHLERLEEEQDGQLNACLSENSKPLDRQTAQECSLIGRVAKFSYGRSITYVPSQCFTGLKRRVERQCGVLSKCCPALEKCRLLSSGSTIQKMINMTRTNLRKRAKDCENGLKMEALILENGIGFSEDEEKSVLDSWAGPKGNVTVRFHEAAKSRASSGGNVNVRFHTEQEAIANKILIREGDQPRLNYPQRWEQFEQKFDKAAKNTQNIKEKIAYWDRNKIAKEGFDSLVDAAAVSEIINFAPPMGTVTPHVEESNDENVIVEDHGTVVTVTESVTSSPVIFIETSTQKQVEKCRPSKVFQFSKILKELGENPESKEMKEILELVKRFENRKDQEGKSGIIEKSLRSLIDHFDTENFEVLKKDAEKMIKESETLPICAVSISESIDEPETMLVDDNGDKFIIQSKDSTAKLLVGEPLENYDKNATTESESVENFISDEYKKEIAAFKKEFNLWSRNATSTRRNDTTCDIYMKCRSQMHMAVDSCAWRFASDKLLSTMAESAESLLFKDDGICSQKNGEQFGNLYEGIIRRNDQLRKCLDEKNEKFFSESVCLAYSEEKRHAYDDALRRLLNDTHDYKKSRECFEDANLIQEKCTNLRDCCPNYDNCRESTFEADVERTIINLTAKINELKQDCVRTKAKEAVKLAVRQLLLSTKAGQRLGQLGLDISRGARVVRMAKFRV